MPEAPGQRLNVPPGTLALASVSRARPNAIWRRKEQHVGKFISGVLVLLVAAGTTACAASAAAQAQPKAGTPGAASQRQGAAGAAAAKVVSVASVITGQIQATFQYTGTLESSSQVNIVPQSSGRLDKLLVDVGSQVKAGDTIAVLQQDSLQLAVQQAEANLASAQAKLATVQAGGRPESVASAQAALDAAQTKLDALKNPSPSDVQAAQTALDAAKADLASNQAAMNRLKAGPTADVIAAAQKDVDSYASILQTAKANLNQLKNPTPADLAAAQAAVDAAKQAQMSAEDNWQMAQNGELSASKATSNSAAYDAYVAAKAAVDAAEQKLNMLRNPTQAALQAAQTQVDQAQANYNAAVAKLNQLKSSPTQEDLQQAQSAIDKSQANVAAAQAKLDQLQHPTDHDLQVAQDAVTQAQQALALAQNPYTAQDVQAAKAAVSQAQAALDAAKLQLAQATLVAPFDGVITQKFVAPGALVSPSTPIVTLFGNDLDIPVSFEESRLSMLKPGLQVGITVAAYPGQTFDGKVAGVYPSADSKTHTFIMKVVPNDPDGKLRAGMFATVTVTTDRKDDATLVPVDAVVQVNGKDTVFVVADGKAQKRSVVQGTISGGNVEIISGVKPGEQAVVSGNAGLNDGDPVRTQQSGASGQPQGGQGQGGRPGQSGQQGGPGGQGQQSRGQGGQPDRSSPQGGQGGQGQGGQQ